MLDPNILYALAATCVIYKLAFVARQASFNAHGVLPISLRLSCAAVGTIIAIKALNRFDGGDTAATLDIIRELGWCAFLVCAVALLKNKLGHW